MTKAILLATAALLCLPTAVEAARLTSAPFQIEPLNGDEPKVAIEKLVCSIRYSGAGTVRGNLRMPDITGTDNGGSTILLSPTARNFVYTTTRIGDAPVEGFMCDFDMPGVDAAKLRAAACIVAPGPPRIVVCLPVW